MHKDAFCSTLVACAVLIGSAVLVACSKAGDAAPPSASSAPVASAKGPTAKTLGAMPPAAVGSLHRGSAALDGSPRVD